METYCSEHTTELAPALIDAQKQMTPATKDAKKAEITDILHGFGSDINVDQLFAGCMKRGASFPRLTISTVN